MRKSERDSRWWSDELCSEFELFRVKQADRRTHSRSLVGSEGRGTIDHSEIVQKMSEQSEKKIFDKY